jgi:hypothetical protein
MGRFDNRIRFRDATQFRNASRIQVRNSTNTAWIDLGTNDSSITSQLSVRNLDNTSWNRVTRDKQEILNFKFVTGPMSVSNGQNFNNFSTSSSVFHRINMTFRTSSLGAQILARNFVSSDSYWEFGIDGSNRFYYEGRFSGGVIVRRTHTGFTVSANTWTTVEIELNSDNQLSIRVNSGSWVSLGTSSRISFSTNRTVDVGNSNTSFRGVFRIDGTAGGDSTTQRTINVNIENATIGSTVNLVGANGTLTSTNVTQGDYTINWV